MGPNRGVTRNLRERHGVSAKIDVYSQKPITQNLPSLYGAVAQLIERVVRNDEVVGLIPICSTNFLSEAERKLPAEASAQAGLSRKPKRRAH